MIDKFITHDAKRDLQFFLYSKHCSVSYKEYNTQKKLEMLKKYRKTIAIDDTIIIDDNKEVYTSQPYNCIHIKPFDVDDVSCVYDKELIKVQRKLEAIRLSRLLKDTK